MSTEDTPLQRRGFFREGGRQILYFVADLFEDKINIITGHLFNFIRPPGAIPDPQFQQKCTKCSDCAVACPNQAIRMAEIEKGFINYGYPYINPDQKPCVVCENLPCISACKEQALIPIRKDEIFLGKVEILHDNCLAWQGELCVACEKGCTMLGALFFKDGVPFIDEDFCIGCGVCIFSCVSSPKAIIFHARKEHYPSFRLRSQKKIPPKR